MMTEADIQISRRGVGLMLLALASVMLLGCADGGPKVSEGEIAAGSLGCSDYPDRAEIEGEDGQFALVVLHGSEGVDPTLQVWGDVDFLDAIKGANPSATEGECAVIVASVDEGGPGEGEMALVKQSGSGLSVQAGSTSEGQVPYSVVVAKSRVDVCAKARDLGILPTGPGPCEP